MDSSIRPVLFQELPLLLNLYKHLSPDDPQPDKEHLQQVWQQLLSDPKIICWVIELEGKLITSCMATPSGS